MNLFKSTLYVKNQSGSVAVETALIIPLVLVLLMGIFEAGRLMVLYQKVLHATYNAVDTLTRDDIVTSDDIDNAFSAVQLSIEPFDTSVTKMEMHVVSVLYSGANNVEEFWQDSSKANNVNDATLYQMGDGLGRRDEGYLIVKLTYDYEPFLFTGLNFFSSTQPFSGFDIVAAYIMKGRKTECIGYEDATGVNDDAICP